jgi:hypothetical protein
MGKEKNEIIKEVTHVVNSLRNSVVLIVFIHFGILSPVQPINRLAVDQSHPIGPVHSPVLDVRDCLVKALHHRCPRLHCGDVQLLKPTLFRVSVHDPADGGDSTGGARSEHLHHLNIFHVICSNHRCED